MICIGRPSIPCTSIIPRIPCPSYPNADCVIYTGSNLSAISVKTNDRLSLILYKINQAFSAHIGIPIPIQFQVDSSGIYAPIAGTTSYDNPTIAGNNKFTIFSQSDANYFVSGVDFNYNAGGGFTLLTRVFIEEEKFTLQFYA